MKEIRLKAPFDKTALGKLNVGDCVLIDGTFLSFRDAGHKRLFASIAAGRPDFSFAGETVYFMGPCPAAPGEIIGSCGPTTSCRMDAYTPDMLDSGLTAQIGKGKRSAACIDAFRRNGAVYFAAIGGCGAMYQACVKACEIVAYEDLGAEAVRRLTVKGFPAIVAIDARGNSIYRGE